MNLFIKTALKILAVITASDVIPETIKKSNNLPGWTKVASYLREIAMF